LNSDPSMSSSSVKGKLKASRDAIQAKDWERAEVEAKQALEFEADNYNALVFRALALLHLKRFDESEKAYQLATKAQPKQLLAWQGLDKFYSERRDWEKQADVLRKLMDLAVEA
jgi:superkiller protein 3